MKAAGDNTHTSLGAAELYYAQALYAVERSVKDATIAEKLTAHQLYSQLILDHLRR